MRWDTGRGLVDDRPEGVLTELRNLGARTRSLRNGATAKDPHHELFEESVCEPAGIEALLDFDVVFSCADRPWARHVLNTVAYSDLIPVVEGGLRLDPLPGGGMRNAIWRSEVVGAGRPCLVCVGQYDPAHVQLERDGSLDDPTYNRVVGRRFEPSGTLGGSP